MRNKFDAMTWALMVIGAGSMLLFLILLLSLIVKLTVR